MSGFLDLQAIIWGILNDVKVWIWTKSHSKALLLKCCFIASCSSWKFSFKDGLCHFLIKALLSLHVHSELYELGTTLP